MWGGHHASGIVPDSLDDEEGFRIVYGDEGGAQHVDGLETERAARVRGLARLSSPLAAGGSSH